ncbi:DUF3185 family protein [Ereboglobus luteus]|uniref:Uncharacterized protein n=1 Tax=Ereboglobus luteus TaxID=1796921 RepID=A0A2U8E1L4_9BACT|nr:DUF3185 family protein [Ereboglobus luteus]AWI08676.1 hypothetical protein CKA38_04870 [Ereboglobus luteus]
MKYIIAIVLIAIGGWLIYTGYQKQESLSGSWNSVSSKVASSVDGKTRVTNYTWYYIGGGALVVVGLGSFALGRKKG